MDAGRNGEGGGRRGALFVLPTGTGDQQGPVAAWISTAGWAAAARRLWGESWIVTPGLVVSPEDASKAGSAPTLAPRPGPQRWTQRVPLVLKTAGKDVRRFRRSRRFNPDFQRGPWADHDLVFVWQRHEPFCTAGMQAAAALERPLVVFVPAPVQWEARQWGIRRPGWSHLFEQLAERPGLRAADVVACGSDLVAEVVHKLGVPEGRILITPSGVDVELFQPAHDRDEMRWLLGVQDRFVVGWAGSFRRFHGLELVVQAIASLRTAYPEMTLLLVGDGPERPRVKELCLDLGVPTVVTGTVGHTDMPRYLSAMDVALLSKPSVGEFHYSPLKLWEYLACGVPVIAPRVGQPAALLTDGADALLVEPDDVHSIAEAVERLAVDADLRASLSSLGRRHAVDRRSWDLQLRRVQAALDGLDPRNGSNRRTSSSALASNV